MSTQPPNPHDAGHDVDKRVVKHLVWGVLVVVFLVVIIKYTSTPPVLVEEEVDDTLAVAPQPDAEPAAGEHPEQDAPPAQEPEPPPLPMSPVDPLHAQVDIESLVDEQSGWLQIVDQADAQLRSAADAHYVRENEFVITTENVQRLQLDLQDLPVLRFRRFIIHIDGDDMLILPPKGSSTLTLSRSPQGKWMFEKRGRTAHGTGQP